jgi:tetratricopeptide (TPR) repeat protein
MTSNHLLLYRLAELMLEHEQHILPVDLLFDDEQIGDLVKSIQIDSPYQQMLFEGVLTESVREEKLYVSFTVEGYFHYVLGEVIYNKTQGKGAEALKQIVEENKLNGAKEGVEQCLIRDVQKDDLTRLIWLIDQNSTNVEICEVPLAVWVQSISKEKFFSKRLYIFLDEVVKKRTDGDIFLLKSLLNQFIQLQKKEVYLKYVTTVSNYFGPDDPDALFFRIQALGYGDKISLINELQKLQPTILSLKVEVNSVKLLLTLSMKFRNASLYSQGIDCLFQAKKMLAKLKSKDALLQSKYNEYLGLLYSDLGRAELALKHIKASLKLKEDFVNNANSSIAKGYKHLGSIMLFHYPNQINKSISYSQKALQLYQRYMGNQHLGTAEVLNNLGMASAKKNKFKAAENRYLEAIRIYEKTAHHKDLWFATVYNNLSMLYSNNGKLELAEDYQRKAIKINQLTNGETHYFSAIMQSNLAKILLRQKRSKDAKIYFYAALQTLRLILPKHHISLKISYNNYAVCNMETHDFAEAIKYFHKSIYVLKNQNIIDFNNIKEQYERIAQCYEMMGNYRQHKRYAKRSIDFPSKQ